MKRRWCQVSTLGLGESRSAALCFGTPVQSWGDALQPKASDRATQDRMQCDFLAGWDVTGPSEGRSLAWESFRNSEIRQVRHQTPWKSGSLEGNKEAGAPRAVFVCSTNPLAQCCLNPFRKGASLVMVRHHSMREGCNLVGVLSGCVCQLWERTKLL